MSTKATCVLLVGDDDWSKQNYIQQVKQETLVSGQEMMNYYEAAGKDVLVDTLQDVVETLPFFAESKLIYLRDTGLFKSGRKEESERLEQLLQNLPEYIVLIIDEKEVDKRSKLYKTVVKHHQLMEFAYPGEEAVVALLKQEMAKEHIQIQQPVLYYFVRNMPEDIYYILGEWQKLIHFIEGSEVTKQHIDIICTFSLETRVFELVKQVALGRSDEALAIYNRMLQAKESPIGILVLIGRQIRQMYQVKYLCTQGKDMKAIAAQMKMPYFAVKETMESVNRYSFRQLEKLLEECLETDRRIKSGRMDVDKGVEFLIMQALCPIGI